MLDAHTQVAQRQYRNNMIAVLCTSEVLFAVQYTNGLGETSRLETPLPNLTYMLDVYTCLRRGHVVPHSRCNHD